ncbi:MAG: Yip1 family protein [Pseudomonadota bacterium]
MTDWRGLLKSSLFRPREAAAEVIGWPLSIGVLAQITALMAVSSALLSALTVRARGDGAELVFAWFVENPLALAVTQFLGALVLAGMMSGIGRAFGGHGTFRPALALVMWFNLISIGIQFAFSVLAATVILAVFALLIGLFYLVWFFWALSAFTAELHGFESGWRVFGGLFVTLVGLSFLLNIVFVLMGFEPPEMPT